MYLDANFTAQEAGAYRGAQTQASRGSGNSGVPTLFSVETFLSWDELEPLDLLQRLKEQWAAVADNCGTRQEWA